MTKKYPLEEELGEIIGFAICDGQNQIHDLKSGRATDVEIEERMRASYKFHVDKLKLIVSKEAKANYEAGFEQGYKECEKDIQARIHDTDPS